MKKNQRRRLTKKYARSRIFSLGALILLTVLILSMIWINPIPAIQRLTKIQFIGILLLFYSFHAVHIIVFYIKELKSQTYQKYIEESLKASNDRILQRMSGKQKKDLAKEFYLVFQYAGTPEILFNSSYEIVALNEAATKIFKESSSKLKGKNIIQLLNVGHGTEEIPPYDSIENQCDNKIIAYNYRNFKLSCKALPAKGTSPNHFTLTLNDITDLTVAQEGRRISEKKLDNLVDALNLGIMTFDSRGKILKANMRSCEIFEYSAKSIKQQNFFQLIQQEDRKILEEFFSGNDRNHNNSRQLGLRAVTKSKKIVGIELIVKIHTYIHDLVIVDGYIKDVSTDKFTEDLLHKSNMLFKYVIENSDDSVIILDQDMKYVFVSEKFLEEYQVTMDSLTGKTHYEAFPEVPEKWKDVHRRALEGEVLREDEDLFLKEDGTEEWTRWECRPWYKSTGEIGGIIIYTKIINEWKLAREELREVSSNLQSLIDNSDDAIWSVDLNNNLVIFNNHAVKMVKMLYNIDLKAGKSPITNLPKKSREFWESNFKTVLNGEQITIDHTLEEEGEINYYQISLNPIFENYEVVGIVGIVRNITQFHLIDKELESQRKMLEETVKQRTLELERKNKELQRINNLFIGREIRMKELKDEISFLKNKQDINA